MRVACALLGALIFFAPLALADEAKLPPGITCQHVRALVDQCGGEHKAISLARSQGYSFSQIAEARKCLR